MGIQTLRPELAVQALDEGIVRRLPQAREVQGDVPLVGPEVKMAGRAADWRDRSSYSKS